MKNIFSRMCGTLFVNNLSKAQVDMLSSLPVVICKSLESFSAPNRVVTSNEGNGRVDVLWNVVVRGPWCNMYSSMAQSFPFIGHVGILSDKDGHLVSLVYANLGTGAANLNEAHYQLLVHNSSQL